MLTIKDPLNNIIKLTQQCWTIHILKEHPEMEAFYHELQGTIKDPISSEVESLIIPCYTSEGIFTQNMDIFT